MRNHPQVCWGTKTLGNISLFGPLQQSLVHPTGLRVT